MNRIEFWSSTLDVGIALDFGLYLGLVVDQKFFSSKVLRDVFHKDGNKIMSLQIFKEIHINIGLNLLYTF